MVLTMQVYFWLLGTKSSCCTVYYILPNEVAVRSPRKKLRSLQPLGELVKIKNPIIQIPEQEQTRW
jgi:hypothetical protein